MAEIGCSEDLPYSQAQIPTARFVGSCFCERPHARKTARRTTIGVWSRTSELQVAESCSVTFCTWGRSIPRRLRCGARPSRRVVKVVIHPGELEEWARRKRRAVSTKMRSDFAEALWRTESAY